MARQPNTNTTGRPFDAQTIEAVWRKGIEVPGRPGYRKDQCGAPMRRDAYGKTNSSEGWEIDHIRPVAKGGGDELANLQPLQWENNRFKSDNHPNWSCRVTASATR